MTPPAKTYFWRSADSHIGIPRVCESALFEASKSAIRNTAFMGRDKLRVPDRVKLTRSYLSRA